jgi:hypothetical protein
VSTAHLITIDTSACLVRNDRCALTRYALLLAEAKMNGELDALVPRQREGVDKQGALDLRERRTGTGGPTLDPDYAQPAPASVSWIDSGDFEWGHCRRTKVRKAPRAHYDHITRKLVLNMDHFWYGNSWMFVSC